MLPHGLWDIFFSSQIQTFENVILFPPNDVLFIPLDLFCYRIEEDEAMERQLNEKLSERPLMRDERNCIVQ